MEILIRTRRAIRPDRTEVVVHEYCQMVDDSPRRNGTEWLPGPKRLALGTGEALRRIDDWTFQVIDTGAIVRTLA